MANERPPTLAPYISYLPQVQALGLTADEMRAVPVHVDPSSTAEIITLGELPPGAPPLEPSPFPEVGTRQIYAYRPEVPETLWQRLVDGLMPHRPSGTGGSGMFGNPDEKVVDEEDPERSWRNIDAGRGPSVNL